MPEERQAVIQRLRSIIAKNIPKGVLECINYGMIGYVVPHSIYPDGYHCDPKLPLPFMSIASQMNFVALYHMGIYANKQLHDWFVTEYPKHAKYKLYHFTFLMSLRYFLKYNADVDFKEHLCDN